jgi:hypothetical protein
MGRYNALYETRRPDAVAARTWQRMLDPASLIFSRLALAAIDRTVVGFSGNPSASAPCGYLHHQPCRLAAR